METLTRLFAGYSIGEDAYEQVDRFCAPYGKRVLLIGGETGLSKGKPALLEALNRADSGLELVDTVVYGKECTYERIHELSSAYRDRNIDMVFGMGGGKAMDTAKGTAWELHVPVFTFPTIPSNCAAMAALSVVYKEDGSFDSFYFYERPAVHCFIHTEILIHAPKMYFRAGMGDTIAKYFECHFSARGDELDYHSALGREISNLCYERIKTYAPAALEEFDRGEAGGGFVQTVLAIIVNTGLVSHMVEDCYNCAVAHSVCYGFDLLPEVAERFLHGDLVGYGILVELALDEIVDGGLCNSDSNGDSRGKETRQTWERKNEAKKNCGQTKTLLGEVRSLLSLMEIPVSMKELGIRPEREVLEPVLKETVAGPDMEHIPYKVTEDMVWQAMNLVEELSSNINV